MSNIQWALFQRFTNLGPLWLVLYLFQLTVPGVIVIDPTLSVIVSWVFLQCTLVTFIARQFKGIPWSQVEDIDYLLALLLGSAFVLLSASVAVDLLPLNYVSRIHHTSNVLSSIECDAIVRAAEQHAQQNLQRMINSSETVSEDTMKALTISGGWLTDRHANYPTTDISAYSIKQMLSLDTADQVQYDFVTWMNHTIEDRIFPILKRQHNLQDWPERPSQLSMKDLFIVKYDADNPLAQRHLELHIDSSQLSFNVALNDHDNGRVEPDVSAAATHLPDTFSGGGTYFMRSGDTVHINKGDMLSHPSRIYHAGSEVTRGKRYILVGFVTAEPYSWAAYYRRFGMFSRCVGLVTDAATANGMEGSEVPAALTAKCQNYLWVYGYELWVILKDPFFKASKSRKSLILAGVLSVTVIALVLAVISVVALYFTGADGEDAAGSNAAGITTTTVAAQSGDRTTAQSSVAVVDEDDSISKKKK